MATSTLLQAALDLAADGLPVFPLIPGEKRPLIKGWPDEATTNPEQITAWWTREHWEQANIGLACGGDAAIIAIDLDRHDHDGVGAWGDLCKRLDIRPRTRWQRTPSGGYHLLFRLPTARHIGNSSGRLPVGIDVRCDGGFIVAAPSVFHGRRYRWGKPMLPIGLLPREILDLIAPEPAATRPGTSTRRAISHPSAYVQAIIDAELQRLAQAKNGERNHSLNRTGFCWGTLTATSWANFARADAERMLLDVALALGLPEHEARKTIKSGLDAGELRPRPAPVGV